MSPVTTTSDRSETRTEAADPGEPELPSAVAATPAVTAEPMTDKRPRGLSLSGARTRFWTICAAHVINDIYPIFFSALVLVFTEHLALEGWQIITIYTVAQLLSGLPQGFCAWATDKFDTRVWGAVGLLINAICAGLMGLATSFEQLLALVAVAMIGNGMFHPVSAAVAGQLGATVLKHGRAVAVSIFFASGMVGSIIGPAACTRIAHSFGYQHIAWLMIPGILMAIVLFVVTRHASHRHTNHHQLHSSMPKAESRRRWFAVGVLFVGNASRFIVNTGLLVLFPIWASARIPNDTSAATNLNGNLIIAMTIGMGVAALFAARLVPQGKERGAILLMSVLGTIATALVGVTGTKYGLWPMYAMCAVTALGFAAILPITISLAQRLLPGRTGLASSLMMGVSWSAAALSAPLASTFMGNVSLKEAPKLPAHTIDMAFVYFAGLLLVGGVLSMAIPKSLIKQIAQHK